MRKTLILTIAVSLLLCAVLCTAGCTGSSDVIVGDYSLETDTTFTYVVFYGDNTGNYITMVDNNQTRDSSQTSFSWSAEGENTYSLQFIDGRRESCTFNAESGILTLAGMNLEKGPDFLSSFPGGEIEFDSIYSDDYWF